mmetsp:Transcript_36533/g.86764  ORF Transcript_36533/g.86764 Transcript_36533/m.86764 type:complete len:231 (+) Transcript_36533:422-1114(+)
MARRLALSERSVLPPPWRWRKSCPSCTAIWSALRRVRRGIWLTPPVTGRCAGGTGGWKAGGGEYRVMLDDAVSSSSPSSAPFFVVASVWLGAAGVYMAVDWLLAAGAYTAVDWLLAAGPGWYAIVDSDAAGTAMLLRVGAGAVSAGTRGAGVVADPVDGTPATRLPPTPVVTEGAGMALARSGGGVCAAAAAAAACCCMRLLWKRVRASRLGPCGPLGANWDRAASDGLS